MQLFFARRFRDSFLGLIFDTHPGKLIATAIMAACIMFLVIAFGWAGVLLVCMLALPWHLRF